MRRLLIVVLMLILMPWQAAQAAEERCFEETGFCISGRFLEYWQANGGLAVFGYPINQARMVPKEHSSQEILTQWFERGRFELHPDLQKPYDVLLGHLGKQLLEENGVYWENLPTAAGPQAGCLWFEQTRHNVCNQQGDLGFKSYWENHGLNDPLLDNYDRSLQLFGLPLSEPRMETNVSGDTVLTQWFERARFEWHPDKPDEFKVLLGLLGSELLNPPARGASSDPRNLTPFRDGVLFSADDGVHGRALWFSDGTSEGTRLVKAITPENQYIEFVSIIALGDSAIFTAETPEHGTELWHTDGTSEGTYLLKDIYPGTESSNIFQFTLAGDQIIFAADDGSHGTEPWRTDGTPEGTRMIADLNPGPAPSFIIDSGNSVPPYQFTAYAGWIYFSAYDGSAGDELWRTDGATVQQVLDTRPENGVWTIYRLEATESAGVYVTAWTPEQQYSLWRTFGNVNDAEYIRSFEPATSDIPANPVSNMEAAGNTVYFTLRKPDLPSMLWRVIGTIAEPVDGIDEPQTYLAVDDTLYVTSGSTAANRQLHQITAEGITLISSHGQSGAIQAGYRDGIILLSPSSPTSKSKYSHTLQAYIPGQTDGLENLYTFLSGIKVEYWSQPEVVVNADTVFIAVGTNQYGLELWKWQAGTTQLVRDINP